MLEIIKSFFVREEIVVKVKNFWNLEIDGFKHVIEQSGINHVMRRHGPKSKELKENIIFESDIQIIGQIILEPDEVVTGGLSGSRNLPTVMYIKYVGEYKYYYIEEILNSKKELRIKTFFKNKRYLKRQDK